MEDLIQNAHTLFDERPSRSEPFLSPCVAETTSTSTYGSLLLSADLPQQAEVEGMGSTTHHSRRLVGGILTPRQLPLLVYGESLHTADLLAKPPTGISVLKNA